MSFFILNISNIYIFITTITYPTGEVDYNNIIKNNILVKFNFSINVKSFYIVYFSRSFHLSKDEKKKPYFS